MINKFILNMNSNNKTLEIPKVNNDNVAKDNNFEQILTSKLDKPVNKEFEKSNSSKDINATDNNEVKPKENLDFEESIKELVEVINNEENFQGNNLEVEALEDVIALLNQIINSPVFENLLPVKLQDPMLIDNSISEVNLLNDIKTITDTELINNSEHIDLESISEVKGEIIKTNIPKEKPNLTNILLNQNNNETLNNETIGKEALSLTNIILETLNSKNIEVVLTPVQVQEFKSALENLTENLFEKITAIPEVVNTVKVDTKDMKNINIKSDVAIENEISCDNEIKNILGELKSALKNEPENVTNMNTSTSRYTLTNDESTEEDKVLSKILGEDDGLGLNKQGNFLNRLTSRTTEVIKEPMVVSKETMNADVIKNVKFMMKNAISELKVKIYPKELGEMTIKLLSEEGILKADIRATSKETYNLLNSNLNDIKKTLEQQNIKIHEVNIGLYSEDTTYHSGENNKDEMFKNNENNQGKNSSGKSKFLGDELEEEALYEDSSVDLLV